MLVLVSACINSAGVSRCYPKYAINYATQETQPQDKGLRNLNKLIPTRKQAPSGVQRMVLNLLLAGFHPSACNIYPQGSAEAQ